MGDIEAIEQVVLWEGDQHRIGGVAGANAAHGFPSRSPGGKLIHKLCSSSCTAPG